MLLCPQCQFENPNTNKFCQRCGTSLTHKTCQECGTQVPLNAETCQNCGEFTGTVWWAIISKNPDSQPSLATSQEMTVGPSEQVALDPVSEEVPHNEQSIPDEESELPQPKTSSVQTPVPLSASSSSLINENKSDDDVDTPSQSAPAAVEESLDPAVIQSLSTSPLQLNSSESASEDDTQDQTPSPVFSAVYVDNQQRYRLIEPQSLETLAAGKETRYGIAVRVLDCQPFQKSPLEALMDQKKGDLEKFEPSAGQSSPPYSDPWKLLGIPAIAQPYLALKESYYQTLPKVHDAWEQDGEIVVLLEDRTEWQQLSDLWASEELSSLQILYWLDEMAKLWEGLEPWHSRQSLLEITNLLVDEDQALGLARLYPEPGEQQLTLKDLGQTWQMLFNQSQRTQFTSLAGVFRQMCTNEIKTISEVRTKLEEIAHEQQSSASRADVYSDVDVSLNADGTPAIEADTSDSVVTKVPLGDSGYTNNETDDQPTVILPMQLLSLDDAGCTDIGHQRDHNEDYFGIYTQSKKQENPMGRSLKARGLYILCDGMGGHAAGEVASAMAVDTLSRHFQDHWHDQLPTEEGVREAVRIANQAIYDVNQQNARSGSGRMGTTLAMMLIENTEAVIAHVGDSRLYRLTRKNGLEQVTVDHEVGQREIKRGVDPEIAYSRPDALQLTQALGPRSEQFVNPDVQYLELNEDTLFIICSDGLSDNDLIETHWQTDLAPLLSSRANLDQGLFRLIDLANQHNGHDNITAILIRVKVRPNLEQQRLMTSS